MSRMKADDYVAFTRKRMGNPTPTEWADIDILRCINLACLRLAVMFKPAELETTTTLSATTSSAAVQLSNDVIYITGMRNDTDGIRMKSMDMEDYLRGTQGPTVPTGIVFRWVETGISTTTGGKKILVYLKPDKTVSITMYYIKTPTDLVLDPAPTYSELPTRFDEAILAYGAEIAKATDQQMSGASKERQLVGDVAGALAAVRPMSAEFRRTLKSFVGDETHGRVKEDG